MPDSQPNDSKESENLSAFQHYLLEEKKLADQYQQVIECKTHHPGMSIETQQALGHYFTTYIAHGADPTAINFNALGGKNPDEIKVLEENISDKLTQQSRDRFARLGKERAKEARWDQFFPNDDDVVIPLAAEAKSMRERIDDVIAAHNAEADGRYQHALTQAANERGITVDALQEIMRGDAKTMSPQDRSLLSIGKDPSQMQVRIKEESEQLEEYDRRKDTWKPGRKLSGLLHQVGQQDLLDEYNNLGSTPDSRQAAMKALSRQVNSPTVPYGEVGTKADGYDLNSMHIVISRDPQRIGESSSGQAWFSCMSESGINFRYLDADIKEGTLVAYLAAKDDPLVRRPLARVLLKPYVNEDTKEAILIPGKVYGGKDDYTSGRRETLSPKAKAAFQEGVMEWVRTTHQQKSGTFQLRDGLYADGELTRQTLKDKWTHEDVLDGMKGFRQGLIQEFLTEHYDIQSLADGMDYGEERTARQKELNTEYTRELAKFDDQTAMAKSYLRKLKKSSLGAIPTFEQVTAAAKELDLSRKTMLESLVTQNPHLAMKYTIFEQRLGYEPDKALIAQATQKMPELAFDSRYLLVVMGHEWSEELVTAAAKSKPNTALVNIDKYAVLPWADKVREIAARNAEPAAALRYWHNYRDDSYVQEVVAAAAQAKPDEALKHARKYSEQKWASGIIESAARRASPEAVLRHFEPFYKEPYAKDVMVAAAAALPDTFLEQASYTFSGQPWTDAVMETIYKHVSVEKVLDNLKKFRDKPYAKDIMLAAAKAAPDKVLEKAYDSERQAWTDEVIETAARSASPEVALTYCREFKNAPYAEEIVAAAAKAAPNDFMRRALTVNYLLKDKAWLKGVLEDAARNAHPKVAFDYLYSFKDEPFAQEVLSAAAKLAPKECFINTSQFTDQPWAGEVIEIATKTVMEHHPLAIKDKAWLKGVLEDAVRNAHPKVAFDYLYSFKDEPFAQEVLSAAAKLAPKECFINTSQFTDQPWAGEVIEIATKTVMEHLPLAIPADIIVDRLAEYADREWARDAIIQLHRERERHANPSAAGLAIIENADHLQNFPWAKALIEETITQESGGILHNTPKFINQKSAPDLIARAVAANPEGLSHFPKFAGASWAEGILSTTTQSHPDAVLENAKYFGNMPYASSVIEKAVNRAAEVSPASVLEYRRSSISEDSPWLLNGNVSKYEPWLLAGVKQAAMKLSIDGDYIAPAILLEHADQFASEDYGKDIITAAAKKFPFAALENSEKFGRHAWAESILSDAVKAVRRHPNVAAVHIAEHIKGKQFIVNGWFGSQRIVTGNELIEQTAQRNPRSVVDNADKFIDIPNAEAIIRKALKSAPEAVLQEGWTSDVKWHVQPWADTALEEAYRASIKTNPSGVFESLQNSRLVDRSWCGALIEESYRVIARKDPAKALDLAKNRFHQAEVPADVAQDAYRRLQARDPEAARQYEDLRILSKPSDPITVATVVAPTRMQSVRELLMKPLFGKPTVSSEFKAHMRSQHASVASNTLGVVQGLNSIKALMDNSDLSPVDYAIRLGLATTHTTSGVAGAAIDLKNMYNPKSNVGLKFGLGTSAVGAIDGLYNLGHAIYNRDAQGIVFSSINTANSGMGGGASYLGLRAQALSQAAGTEAEVAVATRLGTAAKVLGTSAAAAGVIVQGYQIRQQLFANIEQSAALDAEIANYRNQNSALNQANITESFRDFGLPLNPEMHEYARLREISRELKVNGFGSEMQIDSAGKATWPKIDLDAMRNQPRDMEKKLIGVSRKGNDYVARNQQKMLDSISYGNSALGQFAKMINISGVDIEAEERKSMDRLNTAEQMGIKGAAAVAELRGAFGHGIRGYTERVEEYQRVLKPLEKDYAPQIEQLRALSDTYVTLQRAHTPLDMATALGREGNAIVKEVMRLNAIEVAGGQKALKGTFTEALIKKNFQKEFAAVEAMSLGDQEAYFARNQAFIKAAKLEERQDLTYVALSRCREEYVAKMREFAPTTLQPHAIAELAELKPALEQMKKVSGELKPYAALAEGQYKRLTGTAVGDAPIYAKPGEIVRDKDGKELTYAAATQNLSVTLAREQKTLAELKEQPAKDNDPDMQAKITLMERDIFGLQLAFAKLEQQNMAYRLIRAEEAKRSFQQETMQLFANAEKAGTSGMLIDEAAKKKLTGLTQQLQEKEQTLLTLQAQTVAEKTVDPKSFAKAETEMLLAQRTLAVGVKELVETAKKDTNRSIGKAQNTLERSVFMLPDSEKYSLNEYINGLQLARYPVVPVNLIDPKTPSGPQPDDPRQLS